jgi:hypothetical protein
MQTLTVTRLGVGGKLLQTGGVDQPGGVDDRDRPRPCRPGEALKLGEMALRWAAAGMLAAQGQFRRVKGYQELPQLALALERATAAEPEMLDPPSAVSA